jgi:hypothetical protein
MQEYSLPADRIILFLSILKRSLNNKSGSLSKLEEMYLKEANYALKKINKREMFSSSNELVKLVSQHTISKQDS